MGRFINADALIGTQGTILGHNMFAYCGNNPIMMIDDSGNWPKWLKTVGTVALIAAVTTIAVVAVVASAGAAMLL